MNIGENGKSRSFGGRANDLIAHPTGKLIGEWRREYEKGNGKVSKWSMPFQANGTVEVTRSDDMGCVACRGGRTIVIMIVTIRVHPFVLS